MIWVGCIGRKLLDQGDKSINIVLNSSSLFDVEQLVEKEFVLIMAEALMNQATEERPVQTNKLTFD